MLTNFKYRRQLTANQRWTLFLVLYAMRDLRRKERLSYHQIIKIMEHNQQEAGITPWQITPTI